MLLNHRIRNLIFLVVFFTLSALLGNYLSSSLYSNKTLDSAMLLDAVDSVAKTGAPLTEILGSAADAFPFFTQPWQDVCSSRLSPLSRHDTGVQLNVLKYHSYYLIYPIGILAKIIPARVLLPYLNAVSFLAILFIVYWFCRYNGLSFIQSLLPTLLIFAHPAWNESILGNLYMDRFFMPFALGMALYVYNSIKRGILIKPIPFLFLAITAASTNDRSILIISIFCGMTLFLFWKKLGVANRKTLFYSALCFVGMIVYYSIFVKDYTAFAQPSSDGYSSFSRFVKTFSVDLFGKGEYVRNFVLPFLILNLGAIGIFMLFSGKWFLISLVMMAPNILFTIGGAEKTGFFTHYHSHYFPFIIFSMVVGYLHLIKIGKLKFAQVTAIVCIVLTCFYNPAKGKIDANASVMNFVKEVGDFYFAKERSSVRYYKKMWAEFRERIPKNTSISTVEHVTVALYEDHDLYYYPINMDSSDWIIIYGSIENNEIKLISGAITYIKEDERLNDCLLERIYKNGFKLNIKNSKDGYLFFCKNCD